MPPSDPGRPARRIDWPAWLALGWATWFGALYAIAILEARAPSLLDAVRRAVLRR